MDETLEAKTVDPGSLDLDPGLEVCLIAADPWFLSAPPALSLMGKPWARLGYTRPLPPSGIWLSWQHVRATAGEPGDVLGCRAFPRPSPSSSEGLIFLPPPRYLQQEQRMSSPDYLT